MSRSDWPLFAGSWEAARPCHPQKATVEKNFPVFGEKSQERFAVRAVAY